MGCRSTNKPLIKVEIVSIFFLYFLFTAYYFVKITYGVYKTMHFDQNEDMMYIIQFSKYIRVIVDHSRIFLTSSFEGI